MSVNPEAIEAVARAMYEDFRVAYQGRFANTPTWEKLHHNEQDEWRRHARVAAPLIEAQTLREAAEWLWPESLHDSVPKTENDKHARVIAAKLLARAATIESEA